MVSLYPGSMDDYFKDCREAGNVARMRNGRRWNRGQMLDFLEAYMKCALWSETDDQGEPVDQRATREDLSEHCYGPMHDVCVAFVQANHNDLYDLDPAQCGHDFWLSRNGHGTGFWDRGLGDLGNRLHDAAKEFGETSLMFGDDGTLYYWDEKAPRQ